MTIKIHSIETLLEERRTYSGEMDVPFLVGGKEESVTKKIINGEMETLEFAKPLGEMIIQGGFANMKDFLKKTVLDVELAREKVPLLYKPIYSTISDSSFPRILDAKWALRGNVIFLEWFEGMEVRFGALEAEKGPTARIQTFTAGFEYDREIKEFNEYFRVSMLNESMGEAFNALLNHIHLAPIIDSTYGVKNTTTQTIDKTKPRWMSIRTAIEEAKKDAAKEKRQGNILLISSYNQDDLKAALSGAQLIEGTNYPAIGGIESIIVYDGWETQVGKKKYTYSGVPEDEMFFIRPKRGFKELIKKDLQIESEKGDLSRFIEAQIVASAHRGVYAAVTENVQKIKLT